MTKEQVVNIIEELMKQNKLEKVRIDEEWNGVYGDLSCTDYEANAGYHGALLDVLDIILDKEDKIKEDE